MKREASFGRLLPAVLFCAALAAFHPGALGAPGDLDTTFNGTGKVPDEIGSVIDEAFGVALQSDGKIVLTGKTWTGSIHTFAIVRYTSSGARDTSFNGTGKVILPVVVGSGAGTAVAVQSDGKIVAAGHGLYGGAMPRAVFARLHPDGSLDTTFGGTGRPPSGVGTTSAFWSLALQSDGKIVAAGYSGSPADFMVFRVRPDATADTTFNTTGYAVTPIGSNEDVGRSLALQSDGKIVVAGRSGSGTTFDFALVRYNTNGSLDTTFNGTGKVTTPIGTGDDRANGVAIQSDGKIVVVGQALIGSYYEFAVARYLPNGTLDTSFNGTGKLTMSLGILDDVAQAVAVQGDGKIMVTGWAETPTPDFALVRLNANGTLDASFGVGGKVITDIVPGAEDYAYAAVMQDERKIVVAGTSGGFGTFENAIARYRTIPPAPEIVLEHPAGTALISGSGTVDFGLMLTGQVATRTFTLRNTEDGSLTGVQVTFDGTGAGDYSVLSEPPATIPPFGNTSFTVRFAPLTAGVKNPALRIASIDTDENPFSIALDARALAPGGDDDGDAVTNEAEMNLASFGFHPLVDNSALRTQLHDNALGLGLYRESDVPALALGGVLLEKDPVSGHFHLRLRLETSADLATWSFLTGFTAIIDPPTGTIDIEITPGPDDAQFYRVFGTRP